MNGILNGETIEAVAPRKSIMCKNPEFNAPQQKAVTIEPAKRTADATVPGPFQVPPTRDFVFSQLVCVPENDVEWRLIHDLSYPEGLSVNDTLDLSGFECKLATVDTAIRLNRK